MEIIIDDKVYDISKFRHPGGNVIHYYKDATNAFHQFHMKSKKAHALLKTLPNRPLAPNYQRHVLSEAFQKFSDELKHEGYFKTNWYEVWTRILEIIGMVLFGTLLYEKAYLLSCILLGIASGRCGWLMHEAGHNSLTGDVVTDKWLQTFFYGAGCGMSASWWRSQHNRHHATPQRENKDPDLATLPLVAFNRCVLPEKMNIFMKHYLKWQKYLFPMITCSLVSLYWRYYLHIRNMILKTYNVRTRNYAYGEIASYCLYHGFFYYLLRANLLTYLFINGIAANYIFIHFAISHTHLPVTKDELTWVEYAAYHTTNVGRGNPFITWLMSNLNYQIEHHLFPTMPQCNHRLISKRVQEFFKKHDLPYQDGSYCELLTKTFDNLQHVADCVVI